MENRIDYVKERALTGVVCESSGEYLLPDYNGDVKKILHVLACVMPSGRFADGDAVEFTGSVAYEVVYLDGEGRVDRFAFSTDYEMAVKCSEEKYVDADIDVSLENYNLRPVGPRKISAKAQLVGTVHLIERDVILYEGDGFTEGEPELLYKDALVRSAYIDRARESEYNEEIIHLDGVIADEVEVLSTAYEIKIDERGLKDASAHHSGEIKINMLVKTDKEIPEKVTKTFGFSDSFFTSGELPSDISGKPIHITSSVGVKSIGASVSACEDGASVTVRLVTEGKMRICLNVPATLVKDSFLTECETENESGELIYCELISGASRCERVSFEAEGGDVGYEGGDFLLVSQRARVSSVETFETGVKIAGDIRFSGIACKVSDENMPIYSNVKIDLPFEQKVNLSCQIPTGSKVEYEILAREGAIEADLERLNLSAMLDLSVCVVKDKREGYVAASYRTDARFKSDPSLVTVYYPEVGETLFEVSKRFHKSPLSVASVNSLTESAFADKSAPLSSLGIRKIVIR